MVALIPFNIQLLIANANRHAGHRIRTLLWVDNEVLERSRSMFLNKTIDEGKLGY